MAIPKTMRAVRVHGIEDYRLEEIPVPVVGPGEVLVRVLATGVCQRRQVLSRVPRVGLRRDRALHSGARHAGARVRRRGGRPWGGAGAKYGLELGDWAVSEQIVPCWQCRFCQRGQYWMCHRHDIYGFIKDRAEGSWAEYMKFPAGALNYKVPKDIPAEQAALIEPMACAIHAVERGEIELGDTVVIAGLGPIGLGMVQVARRKSPGMLIALDMKPKRLEMARTLGADLAIDIREGNAIQRVLDLTDGYGCDVYIEATGAAPAVNQGLQMLRRLGTFVEFSVHLQPAAVDWSIIGDVKELNIHGSHLGAYSYPLAIDYLRSGAINGKALVSHVLPLERFKDGLEIAHSGEESMKVILTPRGATLRATGARRQRKQTAEGPARAGPSLAFRRPRRPSAAAYQAVPSQMRARANRGLCPR